MIKRRLSNESSRTFSKGNLNGFKLNNGRESAGYSQLNDLLGLSNRRNASDLDTLRRSVEIAVKSNEMQEYPYRCEDDQTKFKLK